MKKYLLTSAIITLLIPIVAYGYSAQDYLKPVDQLINESKKFEQATSESNITPEELVTSLNNLSTSIGATSEDITKLNAENEAQEKLKTNTLAALNKLQNDIITIKNAINSGDSTGGETAINQFNADIDHLNDEIKNANSVFGVSDNDFGPILWTLSVILGAISIGLLIASKVSVKKDEAASIQDKMQFQLFTLSLWPTIGSIISLVWYLLTPPGGTYFLLWGPILLGAVVFGRGYVEYIGKKKQLRAVGSTVGAESSIETKVTHNTNLKKKTDSKKDELQDWDSLNKKG